MTRTTTKQPLAEGAELAPLLTISDLERLLRVDRRTIRRLWERGELPAPMKLGGSNRWFADEIASALDRLGRREEAVQEQK